MKRWPLLLLTCILIWGCAGPSQSRQPEQLLSQVQTQSKNQELQEKLLSLGRTTFDSYKDYAVGPEDLLEIIFLGVGDLGRVVRVDGEGKIGLPLVGPVPVSGLSPEQIAANLSKLYREREIIKNPQITVTVKEYRHQRVMVTGAVNKPGSYEMIGPRTLLEVLGKAGGLNDKAGDMVHIIRSQSAPDRAKVLKKGDPKSLAPGSETIVVDMRRLMIEGATDLNLPIQGGDVVHVLPARMAYVLGAIKKPGEVPVKEKMTVTKALALTQGLDPLLASNRVSILRFDAKGERISIPVDLGKVETGQDPDPELKENDIVFVEENVVKKFLFYFRNMMPGSFGLGATLL